MKEVIISTEAVNSYGTRILTDGIDLEQFKRNPILLWMHRRNYQGTAGPIGRIENLRRDGAKLIGTPVFDQNDPFAKQVESKWENGFLRMASAGLEPLEVSDDPALVLDGQTRATVTRSRLVEVSIVDMGSNDEALQLYASGQLLTLSAGEEHPNLPMLKLEKNDPAPGEEQNNKSIKQNQMNKEFLILLACLKQRPRSRRWQVCVCSKREPTRQKPSSWRRLRQPWTQPSPKGVFWQRTATTLSPWASQPGCRT